MSGRGLRILSLDGGGTRGLSSMYALQEIMDRVVPGNRGNIRPAEYFDVIGGVGPNGLAALLFTRFNCTITQVLEFYHDLAQRLDDVEVTRNEQGEGLMSRSDWEEVVDENPNDPEGQLAQLRQSQVQDAWQAAIKKFIHEPLERWPHQSGGQFDYKAPDAVIGVARAKGIVLASETKGHGAGHGCVEESRQYHVPMLHRTYDARNTRTYYTFYAVGLGTVAVPKIMKSGVLFPTFLTTGCATPQNPLQQLLEECNRVFPGLKPGIVVSLGTGKLDSASLRPDFNFNMHPFEWDVVELCEEIHDKNEKFAAELEKFVLPFDKTLKNGYYRFDLPTPLPFFESYSREQISGATRSWMGSGPVEPKLTRLSRALGADSWPDTTEDHVALASLASLLEAFLTNGYAKEVEVVEDVIANYILYEGVSSDADAGVRRNTQAEKKRKLMIAMSADELAYMVRNRRAFTHDNITQALQQGLYPASYFLNSALAYGSRNVHSKELTSFTDFTAGAHFFTSLVERNDEEQLQWPVFRRLRRELSFLVGSGSVPRLPGYGDEQGFDDDEDSAAVSPQLARRVGFLCELSSMAAICRAATIEGLRGQPQMFYNGALMRHVCHTISTEPVAKYSPSVLAPIADFLALHMEMKTWSHCRDDVIENLLWAVSPRNVSANQVAFTVDHWSLVNMALQRLYLASDTPDYETDQEVADLCRRVSKACNEQWKSVMRNADVLHVCIERGNYMLMRKAIDGHDLLTPFTEFYKGDNIRPNIESLTDSNGNTLLHQICELGYPMVAKNLMNYLGVAGSADWLAIPNLAGKTPLMLVAESRSPDQVLILCLILKAQLDQRCNQGKTALHYCFPSKNFLPEYYNALQDNIIRDHALLTTAPLDSCKMWGEYGAPGGKIIDTRAHSYRQMIHRLVIRGADFSIADENGNTPMHLCAKEGWGDCMNLFFCHRSDKIDGFMKAVVNQRDSEGQTILELSKRNGEESGGHVVENELKKRDLMPEQSEVSPISPVSPQPRSGVRVVGSPSAGWSSFAADLARGLNMPVENVRIVTFDNLPSNPDAEPVSPPTPTPPHSANSPQIPVARQGHYPPPARQQQQEPEHQAPSPQFARQEHAESPVHQQPQQQYQPPSPANPQAMSQGHYPPPVQHSPHPPSVQHSPHPPQQQQQQHSPLPSPQYYNATPPQQYHPPPPQHPQQLHSPQHPPQHHSPQHPPPHHSPQHPPQQYYQPQQIPPQYHQHQRVPSGQYQQQPPPQQYLPAPVQHGVQDDASSTGEGSGNRESRRSRFLGALGRKPVGGGK